MHVPDFPLRREIEFVIPLRREIEFVIPRSLTASKKVRLGQEPTMGAYDRLAIHQYRPPQRNSIIGFMTTYDFAEPFKYYVVTILFLVFTIKGEGISFEPHNIVYQILTAQHPYKVH